MGLFWDKQEDKRYIIIKLGHPMCAMLFSMIAFLLALVGIISRSPLYFFSGIFLLMIYALISVIDTGLKITFILWLGSKRFTKRKITAKGSIFSLKNPVEYRVER